MNNETLEFLKPLVGKHGVDIWFSWDVKDLLPDKYHYLNLRKGLDTMDVWFDSGVSWMYLTSRLHEADVKIAPPIADLYLEGSDQHRGWFQSSLLTSGKLG